MVSYLCSIHKYGSVRPNPFEPKKISLFILLALQNKIPHINRKSMQIPMPQPSVPFIVIPVMRDIYFLKTGPDPIQSRKPPRIQQNIPAYRQHIGTWPLCKRSTAHKKDP